MTKKMETALNDQINAELHSAYIYLSMCAYFEAANLKGMAHWMRLQAQEEVGHALRFFDFVNSRRGRVTLDSVSKPPPSWKTPLQAFEAAFKQEQEVTKRIDNLAGLAVTEKDYATHNFLEWFVSEQVEEEAQADAIAQKLKLVGDSGTGILLIDQELGARTAVA